MAFRSLAVIRLAGSRAATFKPFPSALGPLGSRGLSLAALSITGSIDMAGRPSFGVHRAQLRRVARVTPVILRAAGQPLTARPVGYSGRGHSSSHARHPAGGCC